MSEETAVSTFVIEIGSEEIPSRFLPTVEKNCAELFTKALQEAHLRFGSISVYTTPRRTTVFIENLAEWQDKEQVCVAGPPKRIAYAPDGSPTKALLGFVRTQGLALTDLFEQTTEKGVYLAGKKEVGGKPTAQILAEICPEVLGALPFAKKMRWGEHTLAYARPLHWIVALFGDEVVPFTFGPISSGRETFGHRVHGLGPFTIPSADAYKDIVRTQCQVVLDQEERKAAILQAGDAAAARLGGVVLWKDSLLQEVVGLVEHPVVVLGDFSPNYLAVPKEVILTSMEQHQKSFGIVDRSGKLMPHFLTVSNTDPRDPLVVKKGWERVLHARLDDARFFWEEDLKATTEAWLEKLDQVIFIAKLGSMGDKSRRLEACCRWLAERLFPGDTAMADDCARAGRISKADLVSGMVGEFDTLQGIMGGTYAEKRGEHARVAKAVQEQYLPAGPESPVPTSEIGAILALADKADTLVGCFGLNKIPSGTADPFALRRAAIGILRILTEFSWPISLRALFTKERELYGERPWKKDALESCTNLLDFVAGRLQNLMQAQGYATVLVEACLRAGIDSVPDVLARAEALAAFLRTDNGVPSVLTLKRVANILQKKTEDHAFSADLLQEEAEKNLAAQCDGIESLRESTDYTRMLNTLPTLQASVDNFFNAVMVLCEDPLLRANRLALLEKIHSFYARIADFSALQI